MTLDEAVFAALSGAAGVTAIVGTQIYPVAVQRDKKAPYLVFQTQKDEEFRPLDGSAATLASSALTIDCLGRTPAESMSIVTAVKAVLLPLVTAPVQGILYQGDSQDYNPETQEYMASVALKVYFSL